MYIYYMSNSKTLFLLLQVNETKTKATKKQHILWEEPSPGVWYSPVKAMLAVQIRTTKAGHFDKIIGAIDK